MTNLEKGLKAGLISGVIFGASAFSIQYLIDRLSWGYGISYTIVFMIIFGSILGLFFGIIIGLIFATIYKKLPGTTSITKAIIISIIAWVFISLLFPLITNYRYFFLSDTYVRNAMVPLIYFIFFGIILSLLWEKFSEMERTCPKCERVVPKDANLCPYCGKSLNNKTKKDNREIKTKTSKP
jgi:hypothetical protein